MPKSAEAEFWQFEPSRSIMYCEVDAPSSINGDLFNRWEIDLPPTTTVTECIDGRRKNGDIIRTASGKLILSQRSVDLFDQFNLGDVRFIPLMINSNKGEALCEAVVVTSPLLEFENLAESKFVPIAGTKPPIVWYFTAPPVVRRSVLQGLDYAQGLTVDRVCSDRLKRAIEKAKLTNFMFNPVEVR